MKNTNKRFELYQELRLLNFDILDAESAEAEVVESLREAAIGKQDGTMEEDEYRAVWLEYCTAVSNTNQAVDKCAAKLTELYLHETENFPNYFYRFGKKEQITLLADRFAVDYARHFPSPLPEEFKTKQLQQCKFGPYDYRLYFDADVDRCELVDYLDALLPLFDSKSKEMVCFLPEVLVTVSSKEEQDKITEFVYATGKALRVNSTPDSVYFRVHDSITALQLANEILEKFQVEMCSPRSILFWQPC